MNRNFIKIIFVVTLFVGTFFGAGSAKAIDCCNVIANDGQTITGCHLKTATTPCQPQKTIAGQCDAESGMCQSDTIIPAERLISCDASQKCREAVTGGVKDCTSLNSTDCQQASALCFWSPNRNKCFSLSDTNSCSSYNQQDCTATRGTCVWADNAEGGKCTSPLGAATSAQYQNKSTLLPSCAADGSCRKLSDILFPVLKVVELIFKYIGAIAFIFFIFGGFTMILSFGNAEKFKKGQQVLVAAVIGLLIVFGAYLMITFVVEALGVGSEFKAL